MGTQLWKVARESYRKIAAVDLSEQSCDWKRQTKKKTDTTNFSKSQKMLKFTPILP